MHLKHHSGMHDYELQTNIDQKRIKIGSIWRSEEINYLDTLKLNSKLSQESIRHLTDIAISSESVPLNSSLSFKEQFEQIFDEGLTISQPVVK